MQPFIRTILSIITTYQINLLTFRQNIRQQIRNALYFELCFRNYEQYRYVSQCSCVPIPEPETNASSLQSALFFHYYKDYNAEGVIVVFKK